METYGAFYRTADRIRTAYYIFKYKIVSRCRVFEFSLSELSAPEETQSLFRERVVCTRGGSNFIT